METALQSEKCNLRKQVLGLSVCCPFDQRNPCACPFHEVRKKSAGERDEWLHKLSDDDIIKLITHHQTCLSNKML
ncbi:MAG: hypothetical protein LV481_16045 [Methylacidiphilales bacterium]|nr:hypothetical protein [Candidatus Methylacidiphilales bacterium]